MEKIAGELGLQQHFQWMYSKFYKSICTTVDYNVMYPNQVTPLSLPSPTKVSILFEINTFPDGSKNHEYGKVVYKLLQMPF